MTRCCNSVITYEDGYYYIPLSNGVGKIAEKDYHDGLDKERHAKEVSKEKDNQHDDDMRNLRQDDSK